VIKYGDAVVAIGHVIDSPAHTPKLCFDLFSAGASVGCGQIVDWVSVLEIDPRTMPGHEHGVVFVSDLVALHGTWRRDGIHVASFDAVQREAVPPVPCGPPPGGWPGIVGDEDEQYWNDRRLGDYLVQHRGQLTGWWLARIGPDPSDMSQRVKVIGTVLEPADVLDGLRAIYPSNLCVVRVDYSEQQLWQAFEQTGGPWNREIDERRNRVVVAPLQLSQGVIDAVMPFLDRVIIEPAVSPD
jgi:hypothetical protein